MEMLDGEMCICTHTAGVFNFFPVSSGTDPAISDTSDFCAIGTRLLHWVTVRCIKFPWILNVKWIPDCSH